MIQQIQFKIIILLSCYVSTVHSMYIYEYLYLKNKILGIIYKNEIGLFLG